jgi:hypothetical protein
MLARDNPFRAERIETLRYRLDATGWSDLLRRFAAQGHRGVLVGPHGSGKTTLREELERRLAGNGWRVHAVVLGADRAASLVGLIALAGRLGAGDLLSIDGLDRLAPWSWWRLRLAIRHVGALLATSHHHGRLPLLHGHRTSPALLRELVGDLLGGECTGELSARCDLLFRERDGDLRACLRQLYDEADSWERGFQPNAV